MIRSFVRTGVVGSVILAAVAGAMAQDAAGTVPGSQQQAAPACTGLLCLLKGRSEPPAAAITAPAPAAVVAIDATPAAAPAPPLPTVSVAAGAAETSRLKALAAVDGRHRLRFVPRGEEADLAAAPTLDDPGGKAVRLFSEDLQVVAGPAVRSLADLRDKIVSVGPGDGATRAIVRRAFAAAGVAVRETMLDDDNALDGLASGDIDAAVMLEPHLSSRLRSLTAPNLHLVGWPDGVAAPAGASLVTLPARSYPRLGNPGEAVRVLAVPALLTLSARGARSAAARSLVASLAPHAVALEKRGFDRLRADLDARRSRRIASDERR